MTETKHSLPLNASVNTAANCFSGRCSQSFRSVQHVRTRHCVANSETSYFSGLDEGLAPRTTSEIGKQHPSATGLQMKHDVMYGTHPSLPATHHQMDTLELLEPLCPSTLPSLSQDPSSQLHSPIYSHMVSQTHHYPHNHFHNHHHHHHSFHHASAFNDDPRELESFAEMFKQRRIRLGVTQADVGKALVSLKLPGVGSLSQSTICRFESLTLSHNNMVALRPILQTWLEAAETQVKGKKRDSPNHEEKKRKRTSIAAPEKRSLEAYFAVQQRPTSEKIAAIAEKLELKKSVVRVWFCNQRQKQKRMKYSACQH